MLTPRQHAVALVSLDEDEEQNTYNKRSPDYASGLFPGGEAAKVGGQASYSQTYTWQRSGRALLWPVCDRCQDQFNNDMTRHLQWCLRGPRPFYSKANSRLLHSMSVHAPRAEVYTDTSCTSRRPGPADTWCRQVPPASRPATRPPRTWSSQAHILGAKWSLSGSGVEHQSDCFRLHLERESRKKESHREKQMLVLHLSSSPQSFPSVHKLQLRRKVPKI